MVEETDREVNEIEAASTRLRASLEQCRQMVADYRRGIAADANGPGAPSDDSNAIETSA
jgi:hypothetical protein